MESCLGSTSNLSDGDRQIVQQAIGVLSRVVGSHDEAAAAGSSGTSSNTAIPTEDPDPNPVGDQERPSTSRGTSVWSRFGTAYRNAVSSLRNSRRETASREEQRRLFAGKRPATSTSQSGGTKKKKLVTWTQKFVCLALTETVKVPNAVYKCLLEAAGLGEKKIVIPDAYCTATELNEELMRAFPKLRDSGGFEFLRCIPNTRDLELIDHQTSAQPRLLKQKAGNGKLYIRPIQKDLSMETVHEQEPFEKIEQKCLKCGLMVELDNLRSHVQECTGSEEDSLRNEAQGNVIPSEEELPTYLPLYKNPHNNDVVIVGASSPSTTALPATALPNSSPPNSSPPTTLSRNPHDNDVVIVGTSGPSTTALPATTLPNSSPSTTLPSITPPISLPNTFPSTVPPTTVANTSPPAPLPNSTIPLPTPPNTSPPSVAPPSSPPSLPNAPCSLDMLISTFATEIQSAKQISSIYNLSGSNYDLAAVCLSEGPTLQCILSMLKKRFQQLPQYKLCVDFEDMWSDLVRAYKCRSFNELTQVKVTINQSAAIDAGGVRRQVYTRVFHDFATNHVVTLFDGEDNHLRPVATAEARSSGLLKILGKMVAHSICQEGIGFPYLSPTCYWYIVGGEEMAIEHSSVNDIPYDAALLISQVREVNIEQLKSISSSEMCVEVLQRCGINQQLNVSSKAAICHEIISFESIGRVSKLLDQFCYGLQSLGVLKAIRSYPHLFLPLFVFTGNVSPADVVEAVRVEKDLSEDEERVMKYLHMYLGEASVQVLEKFLVHCTGSFRLPLPNSILVEFDESDAVMAHTCDQSIIMSTGFTQCKDYDEFKTLFNSIVVDKDINPTFNVV